MIVPLLGRLKLSPVFGFLAEGQLPASAAVLGSALAMSSTAIILPSLAEHKRLNTTAGRISLAVLLFQDLAVAPLLFMVSILGAPDAARSLSPQSIGLLPHLRDALLPAVGSTPIYRLWHLVRAKETYRDKRYREASQAR